MFVHHDAAADRVYMFLAQSLYYLVDNVVGTGVMPCVDRWVGRRFDHDVAVQHPLVDIARDVYRGLVSPLAARAVQQRGRGDAFHDRSGHQGFRSVMRGNRLAGVQVVNVYRGGLRVNARRLQECCNGVGVNGLRSVGVLARGRERQQNQHHQECVQLFHHLQN